MRFLVLPLLFVSLSARAYTWVNIPFGAETSASLTRFFAESPYLYEVSAKDYELFRPIAWANCQAYVLRPMRIPDGVDPAKADPGNRIVCVYSQGEQLKELVFRFGKNPIGFFGNNLHKRSFDVEGDLAERLLKSFEDAYARTDRPELMKQDDMAFSTGDEIAGYSILDGVEKVSPLVECTTFGRFGKRTKLFCAFLYFGKD